MAWGRGMQRGKNGILRLYQASRSAPRQEKCPFINYESCIYTQMEWVTVMKIRNWAKDIAQPGNYTPKINYNFHPPCSITWARIWGSIRNEKHWFHPRSGKRQPQHYLVGYLILQWSLVTSISVSLNQCCIKFENQFTWEVRTLQNCMLLCAHCRRLLISTGICMVIIN